jgi:flagellar biosynthesis chaperone FliJ
MKTLKTLIKLHKRDLDKTLREIRQFEEEKSQLELDKKKVEEESVAEAKNYSASKYAYMLDRYLQNSRKRMQRIDAQILRISLSIDKLRSVLREQYAELKKFEIALENKKKLEELKLKKIENKFVDEFNINKFVFDKRDGDTRKVKVESNYGLFT